MDRVIKVLDLRQVSGNYTMFNSFTNIKLFSTFTPSSEMADTASGHHNILTTDEVLCQSSFHQEDGHSASSVERMLLRQDAVLSHFLRMVLPIGYQNTKCKKKFDVCEMNHKCSGQYQTDESL